MGKRYVNYQLARRYLVALVVMSLFVVGSLLAVSIRHVQAADSDFSNGITIDSTGDGVDANIGDNICDDGSGSCTLRAAIQESNATAGTQTIRFNITGTADFTNDGQNGYTITPATSLPQINDTVIIDGYTQPGAQANTAVAPNPLNGRLLIELDGTDAPGNADGLHFIDDSNGSEVRGLVINNFGAGDALKLLADSIIVQGNYIGTDPTGSIARPNSVAVNAVGTDPNGGVDALVGGLNPEDRNLLSGNTSGPVATASYPFSGWVIQGNYVGVAADGLTPLANSTVGGSGLLSIDNCQDVLVGGSQPGAINVFGESLGHGIAPLNVSNIRIEGNYIGLGYDGVTVLGNTNSGGSGSGIAMADEVNTVVLNNRIAGWSTGGISLNSEVTGAIIEGNVVHDNASNGISVGGIDTNNNTIINNTVYSNASANIAVTGVSPFGINTSDTTIQSNRIGLREDGTVANNNPPGIAIAGDPTGVLIGGTNAGEGNVIIANNSSGVAVLELNSTVAGATITPQNVTIIGNSITNTQPPISQPGSGLGIDLLRGIDTSAPPDLNPESFVNAGPTPNDATDADTGPNNYINFPVINSANQNQLNLDVSFDLDAADSPTNQYRVEFFANDTADPSGYGEGQTYLGSTTVLPGNDQTANISLPSGTNLTGKVLSATTTAIDGSTTSGFGSTSEFSLAQAITVSVLPTTSIGTAINQNNGNLAKTGLDIRLFGVVGITIIVLAWYLARLTRNYTYIAGE